MKDCQIQNLYRPQVNAFLSAVDLDKSYIRALGSKLYYLNEQGQEVAVCDFVGGFGSGLFGHNNPELKQSAIAMLLSDTAFLAQASKRNKAFELAELLSRMLRERTGEHYIAVFANTGAEAVEVAIKHSEMEFQAKRLQEMNTFSRRLKDILSQQPQLRVNLSAQVKTTLNTHFTESFSALEQLSLQDLATTITKYNQKVLAEAPLMLGIKRAFHGKTSAAVQLTYNSTFRDAFTRLGPQVEFVPAEDTEALHNIIQSRTACLLVPKINSNNELEFEAKPWVSISALFVEPIQGEGGVFPLSPTFMQACQQHCFDHKIAFVLDEIQCGMGRTGTWLYSEQQNVQGDCYLLAKALGGGLSKISVALFRKSRFQMDFDLKHSSTFAEDDHSATLALKSLALLTPDFLQRVQDKGNELIKRLNKLKCNFPEVVSAVRGVGLMIGLEINTASCSSEFMQTCMSQNRMGWVLAAYLLNRHNIRVAPTLSAQQTIRLQPAECTTLEEFDQLELALTQLCTIIQRNNCFALLEHLIYPTTPKEKTAFIDKDYSQLRKPSPPVEGMPKVAFIGHLANAQDIILWDASFEGFDEPAIKQLLSRLHSLVDIGCSPPKIVESATGQKVAFYFMGLFADSNIVASYLRKPRPNAIQDKIQKAVELAEFLNCTSVGFGGFTSIVTQNCKTVHASNIGLTTGNALTVGIGIQSILLAAQNNGIDIANSCFASVGASGNISQVFNQIMADKVKKMLLISREGSLQKLKQVANELLCQLIADTIESPDKIPSGIALSLAEQIPMPQLNTLLMEYRQSPPFPLFDEIKQLLGESCPLSISQCLDDLATADIIMTATNSPDVVVRPTMIKKGKVVICDIAVPRDTCEDEFSDRPDVTIFQGGVVQLPSESQFHIPGLPLEPGVTFACLSETLLLGLENIDQNFSYGNITKSQVEYIQQLAEKHGFNLARLKREQAY